MSDHDKLVYKAETRTVQDLVNLYEKGHLNLNPEFQRNSVWSDTDRRKLIESILRNYPIPAFFLHQREQDGIVYHDVIDGKQRLETLLYFMGSISGRALKTQKKIQCRAALPGSPDEELVDWLLLKKRNLQPRITAYNLQVIFVEGSLASITDLFIRINSTGRALTRQEKRHARYYNGDFFRKAAQLAESESNRLKSSHVLSANQISRMKHVELISEIMLSCHCGDVIHKKQVLDQAMSGKALTPRAAQSAQAAAKSALNRTFRLFPDLRQTRFAHISDFYSLVILVHKLEREGCVFSFPSRNRVAWAFLKDFGAGVDRLSELYKKGTKIPQEHEIYRSYLRTVMEGTDSLEHRKAREKILLGLIGSQFSRKDRDRIFSPEQRRIIWNLSKDHRCVRCRRELSWGNFTVDHVRPHSKGGKTSTLNAALMCRPCNSSKGAR